jgi:selenide,water dikinase
MAEGSQKTLVIDLSRLPLLPGVEKLVHKPFITRASVTNAEYVQTGLKIEGKPDPIRVEVFYDAQTSGGLLISVPAEKADALVAAARERGATTACVIGEVRERGEAALIVRDGE